MAVEYEISSDVATIKDVAPNTQVARVVSLYSGQITYDDEAGSKFATATINGKSQRVMLCIAVNGTVNYDDVPSLYSTVDGHRCLNIVAPTETGTPDDVPSVNETVVIDGMNVRAVRCILINATPVYDGVSSVCTFTGDDGKTHTAQLVNKITGGSVEVIVKGVSPISLPDAIANSLEYLKAFGGTEQGLPSEYQLYTEVEAGGVTYTYSSQNLTQIPCMRIADNVFGLYNLITQTFTGDATFTSNGTPITEPSPQYDIPLVSNNGVLKARHQSGLPLGYTLLEYIESTGTQFIKGSIVGLTGNEEITVNVYSYNYVNDGGYFVLYNSANDDRAFFCGYGFQDAIYGISNPDNNYYALHNAAVAGNHTVKRNADGSLLIDGTTPTRTAQSYTTTAFTNVNSFIVGKSSPTAITAINVRYKRLTIEGKLNLIPCKDPNGVVGMFDTVSGTFFTNAGTGDFTAGDPVSDPVEVYADGLQETINVHGKNLFDKDNNLLVGYYINNTTGEIAQSSDGSSSCFLNYLPSSSNITYTMSSENVSQSTTMRMWAYDKDKNPISAVFNSATTATDISGTTPEGTAYIRCSFGTIPTYRNNIQLERGSTATTYEPYFNGGTATAEMLLKVGDYQDVQSIIDGVVTRNIGIKVLDGTENWTVSGTGAIQSPIRFAASELIIFPDSNTIKCLSTHYPFGSVASTGESITPGTFNVGIYNNIRYIRFAPTDITTLEGWTNWLKAQYAAGTPVIIVYPLETPTTESVAGQTMQVQQGDNIVEITQASLNGLELEAKYQAAVSLTIQEVQDANLDPNVQVTIN